MAKNETWWQLVLTAPELEQNSAQLFDLGFQGIVVQSAHKVTSYISISAADLPQLQSALTHLQIECESSQQIKEQNWNLSCPALWEKLQIGKFSILPVETTLEAPTPQPFQIAVIPGTGFGTGHHPSTAAALTLMQHAKLLAEPPATILDLGTGSGILSIAAAQLFRQPILAIDNDPAALDNARDNIEMNAASNIDLQLQEASALSGSFNLILANIYAELLLDLMPVLQRVSKPKTWLICAGILDYLAPQVISAYEVAGWELIESAHQGEWVALLWKRTPQ